MVKEEKEKRRPRKTLGSWWKKQENEDHKNNFVKEEIGKRILQRTLRSWLKKKLDNEDHEKQLEDIVEEETGKWWRKNLDEV